MKNGPARFNLYLDRFEELLIDTAKQPDPALSLYQNGARTPLFMLEGLARLYSGLHNKKRFTRMGMHFKLLEDALGAIDYYDSFAKQFSQDKAIPAAATKAVQTKCSDKVKVLNNLLKKKNWLGTDANRISKIRGKLRGADWMEDKAELKAIESLYGASIIKINAFAKTYATGFTALETQVHELRRKLRWLSIYPQAMQGGIQLTKGSSKDKRVAKYLTPDIVNSPFNKMPETGANRYILVFARDYFLALSWIISELGKLKDQGLRTVVLNEVGVKAKTDAKGEAAILKKASAITSTYFAEKNLDKLVVGVMKANGNR